MERGIICLFFLAFALAESVDYTNHQLWRTTPNNEEDVAFLNQLLKYRTEAVWTRPTFPGRPVDIIIQPGQQEFWRSELEDAGLSFRITSENVQELIEKERWRPDDAGLHQELNSSYYHTLEEIHQYLYDIQDVCGEYCEVIESCCSCQGRTMRLIKLSREPEEEEERPAIWLSGVVHSAEWVAAASLQYVIERLVRDDHEDEVATEMRNKFDWYINPVLNLDGYQYTWDVNRVWHRTRCRCDPDQTQCCGADANWNFDWFWEMGNDDPCSLVYRGPELNSEQVVALAEDLMDEHGGNVAMYIDLHSFGQVMYYPWAYDPMEEPENLDEQIRVADIGMTAMSEVHNKTWRHSRVPGTASGAQVDWAHGKHNVPYSYMLELRDEGDYGFQLPPEQILLTAEEVWAGVTAMADNLRLDDDFWHRKRK